MKTFLAAGLTVIAGAALLEAALIPGLVIGGAAVLAPKVLPGLLRRSRRRAKPTAPSVQRVEPLRSAPNADAAFVPAKLEFKRAIAKTITFRAIVTTLDFSSNYLVIGELGTAAGLSAFALVFGPIFYLAHETAWNYFGPAGTAVDVTLPMPSRGEADEPGAERRGFTINRALAKTITFRGVASAVDFTATYVVVGDLATAAGLTAFGLVLGPFVYYGHEWVWDRIDWLKERPAEDQTEPVKLLPAPV
jgi:uncharacterized membrane protein